MRRFLRLSRRQRPAEQAAADQLALFDDDAVSSSDGPRRSLGRRLVALVLGSPEPRRGRLRRRGVRLGLAALGLMLPGSVMAGASMMGGGGAERQSMVPGLEKFLPTEEDEALDPFLDPELLEAVPVGDGEVIEDVEDILGSSEVVDALGEGGIPEIAVEAYMGAADQMELDDPGCGVRWTLLAAIGRVESNHGRFGGAQLRDDGYGTKPIRGIPLDGRANVALIRDTDKGALDGDTAYDRAVGPMQFIPSTWRGVNVDADGDGRPDPNNIFDAAGGAGVYLCRGDRDLRDIGQQAQAVRTYNNADEYVRAVLNLAEMYESGDVEEIPSIGLPPMEPTPPPRPSPGPPPPGRPSTPRPPAPAPQPGAPPTTAPRPPATTAPPPPPPPPPTTTPPTTRPTTSTTVAPPSTTSTTSTTVPAPSTTTTVPDTTTTTVPGEPPDTAAVGWAPAMREVVVQILESGGVPERCPPGAIDPSAPTTPPPPAGTIPPCPPATTAEPPPS